VAASPMLHLALLVLVGLASVATANLSSEVAHVFGSSKPETLSDIMTAFDVNAPHRASEVNGIIAKLNEFSTRLKEEDRKHWDETKEFVVKTNITILTKTSEVLLLKKDIETEQEKLDRRIRAFNRELALLETIHRHMGKEKTIEKISGAVEAESGVVADAELAKLDEAKRTKLSEFPKVAKQLDDFALNIMNQAAEAKKVFNEFKMRTTEQIQRLELEVARHRAEITAAYKAYQEAKQERDSQLGLVMSVEKVIQEDFAKTTDDRVAEDKARHADKHWEHFIKDADKEEIAKTHEYDSNKFKDTMPPTAWQPPVAHNDASYRKSLEEQKKALEAAQTPSQ
jgi:low affinity Fe/Cu permease